MVTFGNPPDDPSADLPRVSRKVCPAAPAVLESFRPLVKNLGDLVFPGGRTGEPLSDMSLSDVARRMDEDAEPGAPPQWRDAEGRAIGTHGVRVTFRMWSGETRCEVVEKALAQPTKGNADAAYARPDLQEKCGPLKDAWAEQCV